jgi:excisionase family DNA binding protein
VQTYPHRKGGYMKTNTPSVGQKGWLTVPEVAQELRIPRSRRYELIQRGELPAVRIGERSIRVNRTELERFLLENRRVFGAK